jgi:DNA helicase HerA-like ATPase
MKTLVINLFGGPGSGKSTVASSIFSELKWNGVNCELATEYAKDKVWERSTSVLDDQIYVFGKQHHRIFILNNEVDVIVTDSPFLLSVIYDSEKRPTLKKLVIEEFLKFNNMNFFLKRSKDYNPLGRLQTEDGAKFIDNKVNELLIESGVGFKTIPSTKESVNIIVSHIMDGIKN